MVLRADLFETQDGKLKYKIYNRETVSFCRTGVLTELLSVDFRDSERYVELDKDAQTRFTPNKYKRWPTVASITHPCTIIWKAATEFGLETPSEEPLVEAHDSLSFPLRQSQIKEILPAKTSTHNDERAFGNRPTKHSAPDKRPLKSPEAVDNVTSLMINPEDHRGISSYHLEFPSIIDPPARAAPVEEEDANDNDDEENCSPNPAVFLTPSFRGSHENLLVVSGNVDVLPMGQVESRLR